MIICPNPACKKENSAYAKICTYCGTKLKSGNFSDDKQDSDGSKTVMGKPANMDAWDQNLKPGSSSNTDIPHADIDKCPKCGHYPLIKNKEGVILCPNCGWRKNNPVNEVIKEKPEPEKKMENKKEESKSTPEKTISLADISFSGGRSFKLTNVKDNSTKEFKGDKSILNRDGLDKDNLSISEKKHAEIYYDNGEWKVSNSSSNKATFIQVNEPIKLVPGQIILIGNNFYRFETD